MPNCFLCDKTGAKWNMEALEWVRKNEKLCEVHAKNLERLAVSEKTNEERMKDLGFIARSAQEREQE